MNYYDILRNSPKRLSRDLMKLVDEEQVSNWIVQLIGLHNLGWITNPSLLNAIDVYNETAPGSSDADQALQSICMVAMMVIS